MASGAYWIMTTACNITPGLANLELNMYTEVIIRLMTTVLQFKPCLAKLENGM